MKIANRLYKDWSAATRKRLRSLTLRSSGDMCKMLKGIPCDTFVASENGVILGWAVYSLVPWYNTESGHFMLYVRRFQRKKGIGKLLLKAALEKYGHLWIHPWNMDSGNFFKKMTKEYSSLSVARGAGWL